MIQAPTPAHLVETGPFEEYHGRAVAEIEAGLHRPEGDITVVVGADDDGGWPDKIEINAIPQIGFDDPPAAIRLQFARRSYGLRDELRQPHEIIGGGAEGEGPDAVAATELRLLLAGDGLDPAERLFDPFADALAGGVAVARRVRPLLTMEVRLGIAPAARRRLPQTLSRLEALHRHPGLDQRPFDREVIRGRELLHPWLHHDRHQEFRRDVPFKKKVPVLGED